MTIFELATKGWHLFPIQPRGKTPLTKNGFKDATNNLNQLEEWSKQYPNCRWGVSTGPSNLLVVDLDSSKEIYSVLEVRAKLGLIFDTLSVKTPSGGLHLYYQRPDHVIATQINALLPAVDIRATTGYVVCPPSEGYEFLSVEHPILAPPEALLHAIEAPRPIPKAIEGELYLTAGQGRWEHCRRIAGQLRRLGCSAEVIFKCLCVFAEEQCEPDESISEFKLRSLADWTGSLPGLEEDPMAAFNNIKNSFLDARPETVTIKTPEGEFYKITKDKLDLALTQGATLAEEE